MACRLIDALEASSEVSFPLALLLCGLWGFGAIEEKTEKRTLRRDAENGC